MRIQQKYPVELKDRVVNEYHQGIKGYKKPAKSYQLTRDLVRT